MCFHFLGIMNNAAVNTDVQIPCRSLVWSFESISLGMEAPGRALIPRLVFGGTTDLFPTSRLFFVTQSCPPSTCCFLLF